jgi:hypothetical protein
MDLPMRISTLFGILFCELLTDSLKVQEWGAMIKTKKAGFQKVLNLITDVVEEQLSKLPAEDADSKRKKIHQIASSAGQRARGKSLKRSRTRANRLSARSHA